MESTTRGRADTGFNHLVILANPAADGFDHAIATAYSQEVERLHQSVHVRDLYALGFDPVLRADERPTEPGWSPSPDVAAELELVRRCDIVVFIYPIWFGLPPAMLKGYVERVLGAGYSFRDLQVGRASRLWRASPSCRSARREHRCRGSTSKGRFSLSRTSSTSISGAGSA